MIRIEGAALADVEAAARHAYPNEACGLLIGSGGHIVRAVETANLAAERGRGRDRFEVDARVHLKLQREMRQSGETILGVFHSHPEGRAAPSETDRAAAAYSGWIWLITAVNARGDCRTRAFRDGGGGDFERCELAIRGTSQRASPDSSRAAARRRRRFS